MLSLYINIIETDEEKDKFERLYFKYRNLMFYVSKNILRDDQLAEDAVHEAFIKIISHVNYSALKYRASSF